MNLNSKMGREAYYYKPTWKSHGFQAKLQGKSDKNMDVIPALWEAEAGGS